MPAMDDDLDTLHLENPGDLGDSLLVLPRQVFDAVASASVADVASQIETEDGEIIGDVDFRNVDIDRGPTDGRFVLRFRNHHEKRLAVTGVVVTGAALIAAALSVRYTAHRRHG